MNKNRCKITALLFLSMFFAAILIPHIIVFAAESSIMLKDYRIDAEVLKNGSMTVSERAVFRLSGSFNGVTKQIVYKKSSGISELKVSEATEAGIIPYAMVSSASNGDSGVYTVDKSNKDSWILKIYAPSRNESRTFLFSYTLKDVATKYNDIAELNWNFIGSENKVPIESVLINIKVPQGANPGDIKVFAHGPLGGESKIIDSRTVSLSVNSLPKETPIEARVLFPKSLIPLCRNEVNENALDRILNQERSFAGEANERRERARKVMWVLNIVSASVSISMILLAIKYNLKYNKDPRPGFEGKYCRELPDDCTPAVMSAIYNYKVINTRDITATLMDLVRKRYLKIHVSQAEIKRLLGTKTEESYTIVKLKEPDENITEHERYFMTWMMNDIGNGETLTFEDIEKCTKSRSKALCFKGSFDAWTDLVKKQAFRMNVFDASVDSGKAKGSVIGILGAFAGIAIIALGSIAGIAAVLTGIVLLLFSLTFKKRTNYGSTQFTMWKAFRRFLREFSNLKEAKIPSLVVWEHYLVYAISLGVANEVIKQLKIIIPEEQYNMGGLTYLYMGNHIYGYGAFNYFNDFSSAFEHTANSAFTAASSSDSSSSGGGGGFSSGSSGGGGGGGFGGF